jgi:enoyl-CoA hydratase/carnithine racemase
MIESITETLKKWKNDSDVYMIYISSNHHQSFCAGGDVKSLYEHSMNHDHKYPEIYLSKQYTMDYIIQTYQKPILTYIDGYVFGGGVGFSIGSSHLVVSERVKFAMPETKIGFFPDVGASYFLNKLPNQVGKYIGILGPILNESDLLYLNIADYVIKHDVWKEVEKTLFNIEFRKEFISSDLNRLLEPYHQNDRTSIIKENIQSIDCIFSEVSLIDMINRLDVMNLFEKELKQKFLEMSPTAMTFTLEMLLRTKSLTLLECLKFEQRLSENVIKTHDFKEGVRSLLVDKDQRFDYKPKTVSDVNKNDIEKLFNFDMSQPHMMDELLKDYEK